jgi:hypothetical protein
MLAIVVALALASPSFSLPSAAITALPGVVLVPAPEAKASPLGQPAAVEPRQIVIELTERKAAVSPVVSRFELALLPDGSPSRLETSDGESHTLLVVRHHLREPSQSTLSLEVERERHGERGQPAERARFSMQAHVAHGKRVLLGRAGKPDGTQLEVTVTLK